MSDLRARVLATVAAEPSPTRTAVRHHNQRLGMLAAASAIGTFVIFAALMSDSHLLRLGASSVRGNTSIALSGLWSRPRAGR